MLKDLEAACAAKRLTVFSACSKPIFCGTDWLALSARKIIDYVTGSINIYEFKVND